MVWSFLLVVLVWSVVSSASSLLSPTCCSLHFHYRPPSSRPSLFVAIEWLFRSRLRSAADLSDSNRPPDRPCQCLCLGVSLTVRCWTSAVHSPFVLSDPSSPRDRPCQCLCLGVSLTVRCWTSTAHSRFVPSDPSGRSHRPYQSTYRTVRRQRTRWKTGTALGRCDAMRIRDRHCSCGPRCAGRAVETRKWIEEIV